MSAIIPSDVLTVDYESAYIAAASQIFFCIIKMKNGEKYRHDKDLTDEHHASMMAEKIYTHVITDGKSVDVEHWGICN